MNTSTIDKIKKFFQKPFFSKPATVYGLWFLIGLISGLLKLHSHNNYTIFRYVYIHTREMVSLYAYYPEQYGDHNLYGPVFSLVVAPFAMIPEGLGCVLWNIALAMFLCWCVRKLCLNWKEQLFIYWFCAHELLTALFMSQFNVAVIGCLLLSFHYIETKKDHWAAFWIVIGTLTKIYGVLGLAFFFFSKNKMRLVLSGIAWTLLLFVAPMAISSPEFIVGQYAEWITTLADKNELNAASLYQNISLLGIVRHVSGNNNYSDLWLIVPGIIAFCAPYLRFAQYKAKAFRLMFLASAAMFICLFSTGTESSGYIIALVGVVIWYACVPWERNRWDIALMVLVFVLTSMSPSDLFPKYIRVNFVQPYSLKALPVVIVWVRLIYEMLTRDYTECRERLSESTVSDSQQSKILQ